MLAKPELYKGISFVRISSLPGDQKIKIKENCSRESIVKIIKDNSLINDCIIYDDYVKWYNSFIGKIEKPEQRPQKSEIPSLVEVLKTR